MALKLGQLLSADPIFGSLVTVKQRVEVLKDVTVIKDNWAFKVVLGFSEQDVVVLARGSVPQLVHPQYIFEGLTPRKPILVPLVILETKTGDPLASGTLLAYSHKAMEIKDKFPFVRYNLVIKKTTKTSLTLWRQAKNFDRIYVEAGQLDFYDRLAADIVAHLNWLRIEGVI